MFLLSSASGIARSFATLTLGGRDGGETRGPAGQAGLRHASAPSSPGVFTSLMRRAPARRRRAGSPRVPRRAAAAGAEARATAETCRWISSRDDSGARNDYWRGGAGGSEGRRGRGGGGRGSPRARRATAERPRAERARGRGRGDGKASHGDSRRGFQSPRGGGTRPHTRAPTGATAAAAAAAAAAAVAAATSSRALLSPRNAKTRCGSTRDARRRELRRGFGVRVGARAHVHGGELLDGDSQAREAEPLRARPPHETRGAFDRRPAVRRFRNGTRGVPGAVRVLDATPTHPSVAEFHGVWGAREVSCALWGFANCGRTAEMWNAGVASNTSRGAVCAHCPSSSPICCAKSPPSTATRFRRRICQTRCGRWRRCTAARRVRVTPRFLPMPNAIGVRSRT